MKNLKLNKFLIYSLIFSLINLFLVLIFFGFQSDSDTEGYLKVIEYFSGNGNIGEIMAHRFLRPGGPLLAIPLGGFLNSFAGLIMENIIFYFLAVFVVFKISERIFKSREQAFYSVIFFNTTYVILRFGLAALTDMGSWFFYLLSVFLAILYLEKRKDWLIYLNGFLSGIGFLIKENGGLGILFFITLLFLSKEFKFKEIVLKSLKFCLPLALIVGINQFLSYQYFHFTYIDWYFGNVETYLENSYTPYNLIKNFSIVLGLGWFFFLLGLKEFKEKKNIFLLSLIVPSLSFFIWPSIIARTIFISGIFLCLISSSGFMWLKRKNNFIAFSLLAFCIVLNYIITNLSHIFND